MAAEFIGDFPPAVRLADAASDGDALRARPIARGAAPVVPNTPTRKRKHLFDRQAYRLRDVIERTFSRLEDWRRIATRYNRLARDFLAAVIVASLVACRS